MGNKTSSRDYDSQETDNLEHDPDLHLKKVMPYGWDGTNAVALKTSATGELMTAGIVSEKYDFVSLTEATLTDTWTFKIGGSGGTTVATVTITYTTGTKETIDNVTRT